MELTLVVTQAQYDRFVAAYKGIMKLETNPTNAELLAQLKREAAAIVYSWEVGRQGDASNWSF